jgi:hypothetical protein
MKTALTAVALSLALVGTASAQHHGYHHGYRSYGGGWGWVAPAIIGGAVVYAATRPSVVEASPAVIVQPTPQPGQPAPIITCPQGTMPFDRQGWVRNQYGQYILTNYVECR